MKNAHDIAVLRQTVSLLLDYPGRPLYDRLPVIAAALRELPAGPGPRAAAEFASYVGDTPCLDLERHYVEVFDLRRRRCLHMTFYADGDTRRRGQSLARLNEIYSTCGWQVEDGELPDHLPVVLEFAARCDVYWGQQLLESFQPGIELLRAALRDCSTRYALLLDAVAATLPVPGPDEKKRALSLARQGPPRETVGLQPYPTGRTAP